MSDCQKILEPFCEKHSIFTPFPFEKRIGRDCGS